MVKINLETLIMKLDNTQECFVQLWLRLGISFYKIDLKALDKAYSIAFPTSTPINKSKKKVKNLSDNRRRTNFKR